MKNKKLKSCPFCGGKAEFKKNYIYGKAKGYFCYCTKCSVTQDKVYATKAYAIKKWNTRIGENGL